MTADHGAPAASAAPFPPHPGSPYSAPPPAPGGGVASSGVDPIGAVALGVAALQVLAGIVIPLAGSALYESLGFAGYSILSNAVGIVLAVASFVLGLVAVVRGRKQRRPALLGWAALGVGALGLVEALGSLVSIPLLYLPF